MKTKIAVIGSSSKLGEALFNLFSPLSQYELFNFSREQSFATVFGKRNFFDISPLEIREFKKIIFDIAPDVIINTIGLNVEEDCENDKTAAWKLNVTAVENLVKVAKVSGCKLIQISSDKIFSGKDGPYLEEARPNPVSYFGKTKLASENIILSSLGNFAIIRVNALFGVSSFNKFDFVTDIVNRLTKGETLHFRTDDLINPVLTYDLVAVIEAIIRKNKTGVFNAGNHDIISSYEFARIIADVFHINWDFIKKEQSDKKNKSRKFGVITLKTETNLEIDFPGNRQALYFFKHNFINL